MRRSYIVVLSLLISVQAFSDPDKSCLIEKISNNIYRITILKNSGPSYFKEEIVLDNIAEDQLDKEMDKLRSKGKCKSFQKKKPF